MGDRSTIRNHKRGRRAMVVVSAMSIALCSGCPSAPPGGPLAEDGTSGLGETSTPDNVPAADSIISNDPAGSVPPDTLPGDMDLDGRVDASDVDMYVASFQTSFGSSQPSPTYDAALDMDRDGRITFADLQVFEAMVDPTGG